MALPSPLRQQLVEALRFGKLQGVDAIIREVADIDPAAAHLLQRLLEDYRYEELIELLS